MDSGADEAGNGPFEAATAIASTRSFIGSPEWPFTHWNFGDRATTSSIKGCQRSTLTTGFLLALRQPLACQRTHHLSRKQLTTYVESDTIVNAPSSERSASRTALISIRWL